MQCTSRCMNTSDAALGQFCDDLLDSFLATQPNT